jgi:tRNA (adenine22-N1)-methyltransferase
MAISKRLKAAAKYLKGFNFLADCGTDHAYLPIFAVEKGLVKKAIASDNKIGPIANAKKNVVMANLIEEIDTVYVSGLPYLNEEIDIASILGMGGRLITEILEVANKQYLKRLVLGPNSESKILRQYLSNNNFKIIDEEIVEEKGKYYQIIVSEPGTMNLNDLELEFGPIILKNHTPEFKNYITKLINNLKEASPKINDDSEAEKIKARIKSLEEVIS